MVFKGVFGVTKWLCGGFLSRDVRVPGAVRGFAGGRLQVADQVFDGVEGHVAEAGGGNAAEGGEKLTDSLFDVFRAEAEVFVQLVGREDGEGDALDVLQVAVGGSGDDGLEAEFAQVVYEAYFRDPAALTRQGSVASAG